MYLLCERRVVCGCCHPGSCLRPQRQLRLLPARTSPPRNLHRRRLRRPRCRRRLCGCALPLLRAPPGLPRADDLVLEPRRPGRRSRTLARRFTRSPKPRLRARQRMRHAELDVLILEGLLREVTLSRAAVLSGSRAHQLFRADGADHKVVDACMSARRRLPVTQSSRHSSRWFGTDAVKGGGGGGRCDRKTHQPRP